MRCYHHGGEGFEYDQCDMCQQIEIEEARSKREFLIGTELLKATIASREASERATAEAVKAVEQASINTVEAAKRAAYLENNPGDYECPACRMTSLKKDATCCPKCQKDVPVNFWRIIQEQERVQAEEAAEERRLEALRVEEFRRQAEENQKKADEKQRQDELKHQKWLASPEYALEREREKQAQEAAREIEKQASEDRVREEASKKRKETKGKLKTAGILLGAAALAFVVARVFYNASAQANGIWGLLISCVFCGIGIVFLLCFNALARDINLKNL